MKYNTFLPVTALGLVIALTGCVTQPTQSTNTAAPNVPAASTATQPTLASTAGALLGGVLQANGGAAAMASSLGVPAAATAGNAAGVLTYCAKNNLLNPDKATQMADRLLSSMGLPTTQGSTTPVATNDQGYLNGLAGMIVSPNGEFFSLDQIKGNVKDKACDLVLDNAKHFL